MNILDSRYSETSIFATPLRRNAYFCFSRMHQNSLNFILKANKNQMRNSIAKISQKPPSKGFQNPPKWGGRKWAKRPRSGTRASKALLGLKMSSKCFPNASKWSPKSPQKHSKSITIWYWNTFELTCHWHYHWHDHYYPHDQCNPNLIVMFIIMITSIAMIIGTVIAWSVASLVSVITTVHITMTPAMQMIIRSVMILRLINCILGSSLATSSKASL